MRCIFVAQRIVNEFAPFLIPASSAIATILLSKVLERFQSRAADKIKYEREDRRRLEDKYQSSQDANLLLTERLMESRATVDRLTALMIANRIDTGDSA